MIIEPYPITVKQFNQQICVNIKTQFCSTARIATVKNFGIVKINQINCDIQDFEKENIRVRIKEISVKCLKFISNVFLNKKCISAKKLDFVYIGSSDDVNSVIFNFTQDDIVGGKLTRTHNLNSPIVDISIIDQNGVEIMTQHKILNNNTVESDFSNINVVGVWKILFEA